MRFSSNESEMARTIGWTQSRLHRALKGETKSVNTYQELVDDIVEHLPFSKEQLTSGDSLLEEPPPKSEKPASQQEAGELPTVLGTDSKEISDETLRQYGLVRVPILSVEPSAGEGTEIHFEETEGYEILPRRFVREQYGSSPDRVQAMTVRGDSMHPTLSAGERIRVVMLEDGPLIDGAVYVLSGPSGLMIKRIRFEAEEEDGQLVHYVWIWSDNETGQRYRVEREQFRRDYRVIAYAVELGRKL